MAPFIPSPSLNIEWTSAKAAAGDYDVDSITTRGGKLWKSNLLNNPNTPGAEAVGAETWIEIPKGASGFVLWAAGTFTETKAFVLYEIENKTYLFELASVVRPYESSDFSVELAAGDWKMLGELQLVEVDTTGSEIELDGRYLERLFFEGSDDISVNKNMSVASAPPSVAKYEALLVTDADNIELDFTGSEVPVMSSHGSWNSATKKLTLYDAGSYILIFKRLGVNFYLDVALYK